MKNITVSVDDDTYRQARIAAAERETSVSALVREFLVGLARAPEAFDRMVAAEERVRAQIKAFRGGDRLTRDAAHERGR